MYKMPSKRYQYESSSSESSFQNLSASSRRRLPSPPSNGGILRNANRHVTIADPVTMTRRVDRIADNLEDTSRNLRSVDSKLSNFRDVHDDSMSALSKLQEDLEGSLHRLRNTREKRTLGREPRSLHESDLRYKRSASTSRAGRRQISPTRDYESDITDYSAGGIKPRPSSSLGFTARRKLADYSSSVREKIHDLSSSHARLEEDLNNEISRRAKSDRKIQSMGDSLHTISAAERVERRLKEIERGMTSDQKNASQLANNVANDVLRRSQAKLQEEDHVNRNRLLLVESGKRAVEADLEATRRRLEQSEGGREALLSQIAELRNMINRSDKERSSLQERVDNYEVERKNKLEQEAEDRHKLAASGRLERERLRQENEIEELRSALKRSAGVVQLDEVRRDLEKSERERHHLSDHVQILTKDLEKKEDANSRVLRQHHEVQRALEDSEREKDRLYGELEDAVKKVKDLARDSEKYATTIFKVEASKSECEREREEIRTSAQDSIRQWKSKCRKLEKENERLQDTVEQLNVKNELVIKENIAAKTQSNNAYQQIENLRKEMDDLISKRVKMDEKLRERDIEIEEINDTKKQLVQQLSDAIQRKENSDMKLQEVTNRLSTTTSKLSQNEEEVASVQSLYDAAKKQAGDLQQELRDVKLQNSQLQSQLSLARSEHKEVAKASDDAERQLQAVQLEMNAAHKQLQLEREAHKKELKDLTSEIHAGEVKRMDSVQSVSKKADEEREFLEGEIHRINMEMNEAKANNREAQKLLKKAKNDLLLLEKENTQLEKEVTTWKEKYKVLKTSFDKKYAEKSGDKNRMQKVEDELAWSRDRVRRLEQDIEGVNSALLQDVVDLESIVGLGRDVCFSTCLSDSIGRKSFSKTDGQSSIVQLRRKLDAVKKEMKLKLEHRNKAIEEIDRQKLKIKQMHQSIDEDRRQLMCEVTEQNKLVDALSREKTSLLLENKEARLIVHDLEDRVANLTMEADHVSSQSRPCPALHLKSPPPLCLQDNSFCDAPKTSFIDAKESRKERERIEQRYVKYKDTIESLQAELEDSRCRIKQRDPLRLGSGRSPSPIKRVTIADTSPMILGYTCGARPRSSSPRHFPVKDS